MSVGKFVMTKGKAWSGTTLRNHIGAIFADQPHLVSGLPTMLLQASGSKNLDTTLSMFPAYSIESDKDFIWKLIGSEERNIPLVVARYNGADVGSGDSGVGAGRSVIELVFGEKFFTDVHVIAGENPDDYQFRILADPFEEGGNYVYQVEVFGGQETLGGVPGTELVAGQRFSVESAYVEKELSIKGAGIAFTSPYTMRNTVSKIRVEHKVSGAMIDCTVKPIYFGSVQTRDSKTGNIHSSTTWMQEVYWQFEKALSKLKARTLMFGKTNRDENGRFLNKGKSAIEIQAGSGIREQMDVSNVHYYNVFSIAGVNSVLYELSEGKLDWGERTFMLRTGERGAAQFHQAALAEASGWTSLTQNNPAVIQKVSSKFHPNSFKAGFQFTEWLSPNGLHLIVEVDPMYDDKVRNKRIHPEGGVEESYRYDIMSIGSSAEPNIQKIQVKGGEELRGYMGGIRDPFTGRRGGIMQTMEDSATITAMCDTGSIVRDPSRTATFKALVA